VHAVSEADIRSPLVRHPRAVLFRAQTANRAGFYPVADRTLADPSGGRDQHSTPSRQRPLWICNDINALPYFPGGPARHCGHFYMYMW